MKGVFYVIKKRTIAQFSYGPGNSFDNKDQAYTFLLEWLDKRKDKDSLIVEHKQYD